MEHILSFDEYCQRQVRISDQERAIAQKRVDKENSLIVYFDEVLPAVYRSGLLETKQKDPQVVIRNTIRLALMDYGMPQFGKFYDIYLDHKLVERGVQPSIKEVVDLVWTSCKISYYPFMVVDEKGNVCHIDSTRHIGPANALAGW